MTPQDDICRNIKDTELQLLGSLIIETQKKVDNLAITISKRNATLAAMEVETRNASNFIKRCDERLGTCEEWRAEHKGEYVGKKKLSNMIKSNITLVSTVIGIIITGVTFYYTNIRPILEKNIGLIDKIVAIEKIYQDIVKK